MEKSHTNKTLGFINLFASFISIFLAGAGIGMWIWVGACDSVRCDYTGLGVIFYSIVGFSLILFGSVISYFFISKTLRYLGWRKRTVFLVVFLVFLIPVNWFLREGASVRAKGLKEQQAWLAKVAQIENKIFEQFQKYQYVPVHVICDIRQNIPKADLKIIQTQRINFTIENVVKPLASGISLTEVKAWGKDRHTTHFKAEITREAYEILKQNIHVKSIELNHILVAFQTKDIVPIIVHYANPEYAELSKRLSVQEIIPINRQFAMDQIIETIPPENFTEYVFSQSHPETTFYIRATKKGYDQLEANTHVLSMQLAKE